MCPPPRRRSRKRGYGPVAAGQLLGGAFGGSLWGARFLRAKALLLPRLHEHPQRAPETPTDHTCPELTHAQLLEAWEGAARHGDRPLSQRDVDVYEEAHARSQHARGLYGHDTTLLPRAFPAHLRRLIGYLATPDPENLALVIDAEELAAELGRSRRSVWRDLAELEELAIGTRLPLWRGAPGFDRRRAANAYLLARGLECEWDHCPRLWIRGAFASLIARVYTAAYQGDAWIEVTGAELGRSQRTFWRYLAAIEPLGLVEVERRPGRANRYRASRRLLDFDRNLERRLRIRHRSREWKAQREAKRITKPLRRHSAWVDLRSDARCAHEQRDSVAPHLNPSEIFENCGDTSISRDEPAEPPPEIAARPPPRAPPQMAEKTARQAAADNLDHALAAVASPAVRARLEQALDEKAAETSDPKLAALAALIRQRRGW